MKTKNLVAVIVGFYVSLFVSMSLLGGGDSSIQASVTQSDDASTSTFTDDLPVWASDSINRLSGAGIISGYSDGRFGASDKLTRGQVVSLLYRTLKYKDIIQDPDTAVCYSYSDIKSTDYYYLPVCLLTLNVGNTVLNNDPEVFDPGAMVTRAEAAKLIDSMLGTTFLQSMNKVRGTDVVFQDVPKDHVYFDNIALVYTTGLMAGRPGGLFDPNGLLNRAEIAAVMDRTLNLLESLEIGGLAEEIGKDAYLTECADLITTQTTLCSGYENWFLDVQVLKQNVITNRNEVEINKITYGPGNRCSSSEAGGKFPADVQSKFLSNQEAGEGEEVQALCQVTCIGWSDCSENEEMANKCTGESMKTSDCLASCDGTCEASPDQANCSVCVPCEDEEDDSEEDGSDWGEDSIDQSNIVCTGEAIETSDCLSYCDGTCEAAPGQDGCSVCVAYGTEEDDSSSDYVNPSNNCGEEPWYDCSQCNGLPSYPTFAYEDCLTACQNDFYNASVEYNACLDQYYLNY